jgi:hypothetical protein
MHHIKSPLYSTAEGNFQNWSIQRRKELFKIGPPRRTKKAGKSKECSRAFLFFNFQSYFFDFQFL